MSAFNSVLPRCKAYFRRHGLRATIVRTLFAFQRELVPGREVIYYCSLAGNTRSDEGLARSLNVECKKDSDEVSPQDLQQIVNVGTANVARRNVQERFARGARLWMIRSEGKLAGYGWTLAGSTISPHYLRLGRRDVHLFDFYVFPEFRRRGINPQLVNHILCSLAAEGGSRAFIEVGDYNRPQLESLKKTPFCVLGVARKFSIFNRTIVCWAKPFATNQTLESAPNPGRDPLGRSEDCLSTPSQVSLMPRK